MSRASIAGVDGLISATEIGALLGVSRQRVDQIAKADESFPNPIAVLRGIRVWTLADVDRWAREKGRIK